MKIMSFHSYVQFLPYMPSVKTWQNDGKYF
nr:MAG TPA: NPL4 NPL4 family, putative zinc binding region [Caudoviricetes sp.]